MADVTMRSYDSSERRYPSIMLGILQHMRKVQQERVKMSEHRRHTDDNPIQSNVTNHELNEAGILS